MLHEILHKTGYTHQSRNGEYHTACPFCGKEAKKGHTHFSVSERGGFCWICQRGWGLVQIAEQLNVPVNERVVIQPPPPPKPRKRPIWRDWSKHDYQHRYMHKSGKWAAYKPIQGISRWGLGVGMLPNSQCKHARLILPVFDGPQLVCLRGRRIGCDCPKWLAAGGWSLDELPLYGLIRPVTWVVENPIDAIMLTEQTNHGAVASLSVSYWRDCWTTKLQRAQMVVVAYDNDLPGNGGGKNHAKWAEEWRKEKGHEPPEPAGVKLVNRLRDAGINALLYDWGDKPRKHDVGDMLKGMVKE